MPIKFNCFRLMETLAGETSSSFKGTGARPFTENEPRIDRKELSDLNFNSGSADSDDAPVLVAPWDVSRTPSSTRRS